MVGNTAAWKFGHLQGQCKRVIFGGKKKTYNAVVRASMRVELKKKNDESYIASVQTEHIY